MSNAHQVRPVAGNNDEVNLEIDDTATLRLLSEEAATPPILVLSRDAGLIETIRKATPRGTPVAQAADLDLIAEKLPVLKPGVLVADTASTSDVASMVAQLTQHFPELVVVVAGKKEDSAALMQLTAAGRIFRFLITPLSHGQTRLALEAAVAQSVDLKNAGNRLSSNNAGDGGKKNYLVTYGALAAGLLVVIGGIWFGVKHFTDAPQVPNAQVTNGATPGGLPGKPDPVKAELALAAEAFNQGKLLEPAGESALDLYRSALALDPNSEGAKTGIRAVVDKILGRAETALTAERLEEAIRNIETARDIDASHPRLSFLDTQIARERERLKLSQAQEVGTKVRTLIAQANDRIQSGRLITPTNGSARDALVEARRLDPTDPSVAQGIRDLSNSLTEEARRSLTAGRNDEAQSYINAARSLGSAGASLAAVERALAEASKTAAPAATLAAPAAAAPTVPGPTATGSATAANNAARRPTPPASAAAPNTDGLVADVRQRITEGKLIDPAGDSARDLLNALRAAAPARPEVEELSRALTTRLLNVSKQAMAAKAFDRSAQLVAAAREIGARYNEAGVAQAERELLAAREQNAAQNSVVSAASLKRIKTVNPEYPESARKRGVEGWVEMIFTVTPNGTVDDVEVRNASPADVFDDAAKRAIRQWRFEPVVRNGEKVSQRAVVRLRFAKEN
jgi:TonB family protein